MRAFRYDRPRTLEEALHLLDRHGDRCKVLAGGTALLLLLRNRLIAPEHVVDIGAIESLGTIEASNGAVRIGGTVTHRALERAPVIRECLPVISAMARELANVQVRNRGTLGGNICHADPASDPPTLLVALGATCVVESARRGARELPLADVLTGYYQTALAPDELLTEVRVPRLPAGSRAAFRRFVTSGEDRPIAAVGACLEVDAEGRCRDLRLAVGAAGATPVRVRAAEDHLRGRPVTEEALVEAGEIAAGNIEPLDDFRGSAEYRRAIVHVLVRRTVGACLPERGSARGGTQ